MCSMSFGMTSITSISYILILLICELLLIEAKSIVDSKKCYNASRDFYPYFSTRTPYQVVRGRIQRPKDCEPLQIWMTARHGARYPNIPEEKLLDLEKYRDHIILNHKQGRGQICSKDLENFRLWQKNPNFYNSNNSNLASEGKKELYLLAKRLKSTFPELLKSDDPSNYKFLATKYERSSSSLLSFAGSLLGMDQKIEYEDDEMKTGRNCGKWIRDLEIDKLLFEHHAFVKGPEMHKALKNITIRLGFSELVSMQTIRLMYDVCRYENALNPNIISTWCYVFKKEELVVFEYLEDLDYYHVSGPGNNMIKDINCGLIKNLYDTFKDLETRYKPNQPKGIFYFGHSTNIQSLLALLKVFDSEDPLLASNFKSGRDRLYRLSMLGPFATNVVAIFYRCNGTTPPNKVMFYVAENEIPIPGCDGGFCDWDYLKQEFKPIIQQCDLNFCDIQDYSYNINVSSTFTKGHMLYFLFAIFVLKF